MAVTHSDDGRAALADGLADFVESGAGSPVLRVREDTTILCDIELPVPTYFRNGLGRIELLGTPLEGEAVASGNANNFEILNGDGDLAYGGTISLEGQGGDLAMDDLEVTIGEPVAVNSHAYRASN